jgi:DNA-binding YbaB/EbfC family protein
VKNIQQMMKQAQAMQAKMAEMQERLNSMEFTGQSGGGMVTVIVNGKGDAKKVKLDPSVVDKDDVEMLEDLIVAALNDGRTKAEAAMAEETRKAMGGLQLPPGMKLPF